MANPFTTSRKQSLTRAIVRRFGASVMPLQFTADAKRPHRVRVTDTESGSWIEGDFTGSRMVVVAHHNAPLIAAVEAKHAAAMVPQQAQPQQANAGASHSAPVEPEARPYTVTLTCGDMFACSPEEAARMFRDGMQTDYAAWPLLFCVTQQDTGAVSYVDIPADDSDA